MLRAVASVSVTANDKDKYRSRNVLFIALPLLGPVIVEQWVIIIPEEIVMKGTVQVMQKPPPPQ